MPFSKSVVVIGPYGVGKTTQSARLAQRLGWPHFELDIELPYILERLKDVTASHFFALPDRSELRCQYYPGLIKEFLELEPKPAIFDFGDVYSVFTEQEHIEEVSAILKDFEVVLLLPSATSSVGRENLLKQIKERKSTKSAKYEPRERVMELINYGLESESNNHFATITVFVESRTEEQVLEEICSILSAGTISTL